MEEKQKGVSQPMEILVYQWNLCSCEEYQKTGNTQERGRLLHQYGRKLLAGALEEEGVEYACLKSDPKGKLHCLTSSGEEACYVSITHCDGLVACAVSSVPVGIDAESKKRKVAFHTQAQIGKRLFSPKLQKNMPDEPVKRKEWFLTYWTLYESMGKLLGNGLCEDLSLQDINAYVYETRESNDYVVSVMAERAFANTRIVWIEK